MSEEAPGNSPQKRFEDIDVPEFLSGIEKNEIVYESTGRTENGMQVFEPRAISDKPPEASAPTPDEPDESVNPFEEALTDGDPFEKPSRQKPEILNTNGAAATIDKGSLFNKRVALKLFNPTMTRSSFKEGQGYVDAEVWFGGKGNYRGQRINNRIENGDFKYLPRLETDTTARAEIHPEEGVYALAEYSPTQGQRREDNIEASSTAAQVITDSLKNIDVSNDQTVKSISDAIEKSSDAVPGYDTTVAVSGLKMLPNNKAALVLWGTPTVYHARNDGTLGTYTDTKNPPAYTGSMRVVGFPAQGVADVKIIDVQPGERIALTTESLAEGGSSVAKRRFTVNDTTRQKFVAELMSGSTTEAAQNLLNFPEEVMPDLKSVGYESSTNDRGVVVIDIPKAEVSGTSPETNLPSREQKMTTQEIISKRPKYEQPFLGALSERINDSERFGQVFETIIGTDNEYSAATMLKWKAQNFTAERQVATLLADINDPQKRIQVAPIKTALTSGGATTETVIDDIKTLKSAYQFLLEFPYPSDNVDEITREIQTRLETIRSLAKAKETD
jgi:hypothetical protein